MTQNLEKSALTSFLDDTQNALSTDFLLPVDQIANPALTVYLLGTERSMTLHVARSAKVGDLLRHVMTVYRREGL